MGDSLRMANHCDVTTGSGLGLSCRRSVTTHLEHNTQVGRSSRVQLSFQKCLLLRSRIKLAVVASVRVIV
ncbi:unnamed protein product [Larinioides sclopetarius]|uniref:Uncharacterized protein n=1 Tax=Larinioides sclopetarius TaxID=280406 RepID=A0AAV2BCA2_9ARAC